ncbi:MAG: PP2C family protein-serine/threonine phosphatase [Lachnospiraceae bacterium]
MVKFELLSNAGDREHNEDYIGMYQNGSGFCFVLADGLGGHGNGEVASQAAVDAVIQEFSNDKNRKAMDLSEFFRCAQEKILKLQEGDIHKRGMRTTLVVLELANDYAVYGHVGDSRLYVFRNGKIQTRTLDHSVPQMLVNAGELKEKKIRNHPDRNRVLRAMGEPSAPPKYELSTPIPLTPNMAFLLCSDGFWELIDEKKMEACLKKSANPAQWLEKMETIVKKNGKRKDMDNYSAIGVWIV